MNENAEKNRDHRYFDQAAATWEENPLRIALARSVSASIMREVPLSRDMAALEFGCGTGLVSVGLAGRVGRILAVDTARGMLDVLERKILESGIPDLTTRQMDLTAEAFAGDRFDLVFSSMAIHHVKDVPGLLRVFNRLLNPGGYLALADLDTEDGGFHGNIPDVFHFGFERSVFAGWMDAAGFSDIRLTTAHVMKKPHARTGAATEFPVFLAKGRKPA